MSVQDYLLILVKVRGVASPSMPKRPPQKTSRNGSRPGSAGAVPENNRVIPSVLTTHTIVMINT